MSLTYKKISQIQGPLVFVRPIENHRIKFASIVQIRTEEGIRHGRVLEVNQVLAVIEVFEGTFGLSLDSTEVTFLNETFKIGVSREMLGRQFNGLGEPLEGDAILPEEILDINGLPINPIERAYPTSVIQTGISTIDGLNTLIRGQKLPIFTGQGLPHNNLAAQIVMNAKVRTNEPFITIFCGIGLLADEAMFFRQKFEERGSAKVINFINLASDPIIERLLIPRIALTTAEFLAFKHDMHVLVVITDITNYAEALREISNAKGEIPARKGFPGYMYSDFASLYERAGRIRGKPGSITQIPIISMPNDDITHPIPDLTGYITEGQIVLSRDYHQKGFFPPINILSSLSRLMKEGIGEGSTREDHGDLASQLYALYSRSLEIRELESIIGSESLSEVDKLYLKFGKLFETIYINQGSSSERNFEDTLNIGWKLCSIMGRGELTRINQKYLQKYFLLGIEEFIES
jgi:V/A-type H+-transporting ATPase subunit B